MELENPNIRYKVCFKCEVYIHIYVNDAVNKQKLKIFEKNHSGHMTQTINLCEIPEHFIRINIIIEKTREKTLYEIREMLKNEKMQNL